MKTSISTKMMNALRKANKRLTQDARSKLLAFVLSQQTECGAFVGKGGKEDLYYTAFGWLVAYMQGIRLDADKMRTFLSGFDAESLDLIHYISWMKCKKLQRLVSDGMVGMLLNVWSVNNVRTLDSFCDFPQGDRHSPYTQFLWLSMLEDYNVRLIGKKQTLIDLQDYKVKGGGYANLKDCETASANATAAALMIKAQLAVYDHVEAVALKDMQEENGGFKADALAPIPDLLSTATSLFALKNYGIRPKYEPLDFIEAHFSENGGFSATLFDDRSDMEYVFYGLLALGSL
jgi:hypothetical protein